jgi:hypothetical protein
VVGYSRQKILTHLRPVGKKIVSRSTAYRREYPVPAAALSPIIDGRPLSQPGFPSDLRLAAFMKLRQQCNHSFVTVRDERQRPWFVNPMELCYAAVHFHFAKLSFNIAGRTKMNEKKLRLLAGLSVLLVGIGIQSSPVAAQGVEFQFGEGGVRIERPGGYDRRYDRRDDRRYGRSGCSPREALAAASRYLNDPYINSQNRNYYFIDGYGKRGGSRNRPDSVVISRAPGCERG